MVKPIALPDNLAKTPLAERVNQLQKAAPDIDQKQASQVVRDLHIQRQREAVPTEKTDEAVIHREKPKQEHQSQEKKKNHDDDEEKKKQSGLDLTA
jgi:hypothetical protein